MQLEWNLPNNNQYEKENDELFGSAILAQIAANRGIDTFKKAKIFLEPEKYEYSSPLIFKDMEKAVERIKQAISSQQNIVICGDFDSDGVTSTALLYKTLVKIGAKVGCYIPDRQSENHGLNSKAICEIISKQRAKLIITVDNGISNLTEVKLAKSLGCDVIITDHHEPPEELPPACAIINPKCSNLMDENTDFNILQDAVNFAGVFVTYKLANALLSEFNKLEFLEEIEPLAMLGTISDVMPILGENRSLVKKSLEKIKINPPKWFELLFKNLDRKLENVTSEQIAFLVAPRINAAGRLENANIPLKLLTTEDENEMDFCIKQLNEFNSIRQQLCETSFSEALIKIDKDIDLKHSKAIVLADETWHIGIVGLLASKLVELFNRPCFIMNIDKNENIAKCSIRGIKGFNVYNTLCELSDCLSQFGGHELAGGFEADLNQISLDELIKKINNVVNNSLDKKFLSRKINIDYILNPNDLNIDFINKISLLEPFGAGNFQPVFGFENMVLKRFDVIGNNSHMKLYFTDSGENYSFECMLWGKNSHIIELNDVADISFIPQINTFRDNTTIQLILKNIYIKNRKINVNINEYEEPEEQNTILVNHRGQTNFLKPLESYLTENFGAVFVENTKIKSELSNYPNISSMIVNRFEITEADELFILEPPCDKELFNELIKKASPKKVHLFSSQLTECDVQDFIRLVCGMLNYSSKHNNGIIEREKMLCYLSCSDYLLNICFDLLERAGTAVFENIDGNLVVKSLNPTSMNKLSNNDIYMILKNELQKSNKFRHDFLTLEGDKLKTLLKPKEEHNQILEKV